MKDGGNAWLFDGEAFQMEVNTATTLLGANVLIMFEDSKRQCCGGPGGEGIILALPSPSGVEGFYLQSI